MKYIFNRIIGMLLFIIPFGIIMGVLGEYVIPWLNRTGIIHISTRGKYSGLMLIGISFAIYLLLLYLVQRFIAKRNYATDKYDFNNWASDGYELAEIISEQSEQSISFLEHLMAYEIKRIHSGNPKEAEVRTNVKALMGLLQSQSFPDKTNSVLVPMINHIAKQGRSEFRRGGNEEVFGLPVYLKMIEDYYARFGSDFMRTNWFFLTKEPPIEEFKLEGQPLWVIAATYIDILETMSKK